MSEAFYLSGLDSGWFSSYFEAYHLFGYIGDRDRLSVALYKKSLLRRILEIAAPRINIGTILNTLTNFNLFKVDPDKTLAREIINLVTEEENNRKITQLLQSLYKRAVKQNRYFTGVSESKSYRNDLFSSNFNSIQDQLITVEGQLVHRTTVPQYSRTLEATLRASEGDWILTDFPPHALVDENQRFKGKVLLLKEDPGFAQIFSTYLPFCREIGWYPYIRITGFFDSSRIQTDLMPSLSVSMVEYRRPRIFREVRRGVLDFIKTELEGYSGKRNYLKEWSSLILFAYLIPILFKGSNLTTTEADAEATMLLRKYLEIEQVKEDLPKNLADFYSALP